MTDLKVYDSKSAMLAASKYLDAHYGREKLEDVTYSKVWYVYGNARDMYEIEGEATIKTKDFDRAAARFKRITLRFKLLIDPVSGNLIELEI